IMERTLGIFGLIDLRPVAYQKGHRFYDTEEQKTFILYKDETLEILPWFLNIRVFWVPTIDELLQQARLDQIRVSFWFAGNRRVGTYRTFVYDMKFPQENTYEVGRYTTLDPWFAIAVPLAYAYQRRFQQYGLEHAARKLYAKHEEPAKKRQKLVSLG